VLEINDFDAVRISLASAEQILSWSYGEVTKPETSVRPRTLSAPVENTRGYGLRG